MKHYIKHTHISHIKHGDVVEFDNKLKTVSPGDIRTGFMGRTIWGDSYFMGTKPVNLVVIETHLYQKTTHPGIAR